MSKLTNEMARHMREIHFGNNWSDSAMQDVLKDVTWEQALKTPIPNTNSIAVLVFHMNFYLDYVHRNLKNDIFIFDHDDSFKAPLYNLKRIGKPFYKKHGTTQKLLLKRLKKSQTNTCIR
jgi:hypothetical protein